MRKRSVSEVLEERGVKRVMSYQGFALHFCSFSNFPGKWGQRKFHPRKTHRRMTGPLEKMKYNFRKFETVSGLYRSGFK